MATGDLDLNGTEEIIQASNGSTNSSNTSLIHIYDGQSYELLWSIAESFQPSIPYVNIAQLDSDEAPEILIARGNILRSYDGMTHALEWQTDPFYFDSNTIVIEDVDNDQVDDIILRISTGTPNYEIRVLILDGSSNTILWQSNPFDSAIKDIAAGDLDGDSQAELAILAQNGVYVFKTDTWTQILLKPLSYESLLEGSHVAILPEDAANQGKLLTFTRINSSTEAQWFQVWDGNTFKLEKSISFSRDLNLDIDVLDVDLDGFQEIAFTGYMYEDRGGIQLYFITHSIILLGSLTYPEFWVYQNALLWGQIESLAAADLDMDGEGELLLGTSSVMQVNEIIKTPHYYERLYLPAITGGKDAIPGIYGRVTQNGVSAAGIQLDLRFFDGYAWSTLLSTTTNVYGMYGFPEAPSLFPGQYYYVLYQNPEDNPNRLWTWHTRSIGPYTSGDSVLIGNFDVATVNLVSPPSNVSLKFPVVFSWGQRPNSPTDSYELDLIGVYYPNATWWTDPLGYTGQYQLNGLPPGFVYYDQYAWEIWIYSPDGGYGVSYDAHLIQFNNNPFRPELIEQIPWEKNLPEILPRYGKK